MRDDTAVPVRRSARVLLFNDDAEVLLLRAHDKKPVDPARENTPYWSTIGGGVEPGESLEQCLRREVMEETGIDDLRLIAPLWRLRRILHLNERPTLCDEMYFYGRTSRRDFDCSGWQPEEALSLLSARWWSIDAIRSSCDVFLPEGLVSLIERLSEGDVPAFQSEER